MVHSNAALTPVARLRMVKRVLDGHRVADVAGQLQVSRKTVYKWVRRYEAEGPQGMVDRSSRPLSSPRRTERRVEDRIVRARTTYRWGADRIGLQLGMPASTVQRVLNRRRCPKLSMIDRATGDVVRRYERSEAGSLVHVDVKKLGRIPDGGGWRAHGRSEAVRGRGIGYEYVHTMIDDYSRYAYSEILDDETGPTSASFVQRGIEHFNRLGVTIRELMTDNALAYTRSHAFEATLAEHHITHIRIRPRRPQTNGKVERFNRTLLEEFAYAQLFTSTRQRRHRLDPWLHAYNHHRAHTAIGTVPADRVNNVCKDYT
jgi:transposase InsO family protein